MDISSRPATRCSSRRSEPPTRDRDSIASFVPPSEPGVEVVNASGTLRVRVSGAGLPLRVQIAPALLARGAQVVADEVLRLCRR